MRVIALLATYNEGRFIASCLEHLFQQGVQVYLIDNESTDDTVSIAERYRDRGVIGIETLPRQGMFSLTAQLKRKEHLAHDLEADWFIHLDADEIRLPPSSWQTLVQAFAAVTAQGYNAVNFMEYTFVPTREAPDHDHPGFQRTMRWYYPFLPTQNHQLKAWRRQRALVDLASTGGHHVQFSDRRIYPVSFPMKHYLVLSRHHALEKYAKKKFESAELERGWHGWRARLTSELIQFPSQSELKTYISNEQLDPSNARTQHMIFLDELLEEAHTAS